VVRGSPTTGWTVNVWGVLNPAIGTGTTSRARYLAVGADHGTDQYPPGPIKTAAFQLRFMLWPPDPILPPNPVLPPHPIVLGVTLTFHANGSVAAAQAQLQGPQPPVT
jgi:hypothetical protein